MVSSPLVALKGWSIPRGIAKLVKYKVAGILRYTSLKTLDLLEVLLKIDGGLVLYALVARVGSGCGVKEMIEGGVDGTFGEAGTDGVKALNQVFGPGGQLQGYE